MMGWSFWLVTGLLIVMTALSGYLYYVLKALARRYITVVDAYNELVVGIEKNNKAVSEVNQYIKEMQEYVKRVQKENSTLLKALKTNGLIFNILPERKTLSGGNESK